jgi:excisionase family DNA binding protein
MKNHQEYQQKDITEECFLDIQEAADFLKVKTETIYAWVHGRRIPFRKHGSRLAFSKKELEQWSQSNSFETLTPLKKANRV